MGRRHKEWAKRKRQELIKILGGKCAMCPPEKKNRLLEIDHVEGRSYSLRSIGSDSRISRYFREYNAGVKLRVLCRYHNAQQGAIAQHTNTPF